MRYLKKWIPAVLILLMVGMTSYASEPVDKQKESVAAEEKESAGYDHNNEGDLGIQNNLDMVIDENGNNTTKEAETNNISEKSNVQNIPVIGNIEVVNADKPAGKFRVYLSGFQNRDLIKSVQVPIWSEEKGQDDLVWYTADQDGNNYYVDVDISRHRYSTGVYQIHAYIIDTLGIKKFSGGVTFDFNVEKGTLRIERKSDTTYQVTLSGLSVPGGEETVRFPVWSQKNGQDDIKWYPAEKNNNGDYEALVNIRSHKSLGIYNIHAYAGLKSGKDFFVGGDSCNVESPVPKTFNVVQSDKARGTFRVLLSQISSPDLIKEVRIPVWSERNGQDDLVWYKAFKDSNDDYYVDINISKHKYTLGLYNAHAYITDVLGNTYCVAGVTQNMSAVNSSFQCIENNEKEYTIELRDLIVPGGCKEIQFPVWSTVKGQDDLKWYTAQKDKDGVYRYTVDVGRHVGLGEFQVHAYARMKNDSLQYLGGTCFETETPSIGDVIVDTTEKAKGGFQVKVTGVKNSQLVRTIQIPVWSASNQNDLVWYTAIKNQNGEYVVNVNISNHKYNCALYNIHVYMTDITGVKKFDRGISCDMSPGYAENGFIAEDIDQKEMTYRITLKGLIVPTGEKSVRFAVWGIQNGQNDLRWYNAVKQADGGYACDVPIINHKEFGSYNVHAYCNTGYKSNIFIGGTAFELTKKPQAEIQVSDTNGTNGTFTVTIKNVFAPSGVNSMQVPVWVDGNQNDIKWYTASKLDDSTYSVRVSAANHKHHFGEYKIHVYVTMGNGINRFATGSTAVMDPLNYIYCQAISSTKEEIGIKGCTASRVQFPTWSNDSGQDDVIWYNGTNHGNGTWSAVVNSISHKHAGNYTTHVYAAIDGAQKYMGQLSYSLQRIPPEQEMMYLKANGYSSSTGYLILVNCSAHKVGIFQGFQGNWNCVKFWDCTDGAPSTPTVRGEFTVGDRGHYFDAYGCRQYWWTQFYRGYLFHSVIYTKQGQLVDGRLGQSLSHGCIRLNIDDAKWIYDNIPSGTKVVVY